MQADSEQAYLLKAIDASDSKLFIISTDFTILAANQYTKRENHKDLIGKQCHELFYEDPSPCENCPAENVLKTGKPVLRDMPDGAFQQETVLCRYSYPILSDNEIDALVILEFERPSSEEMEEKLGRANAFLRNLLLSSVDAVIAADKTGRILIFNDAAAEFTGYSVEEALEKLDIRDVYPNDGARDIMRKLRSDDYGGKGKLKSFQVDAVRKDGARIPISLNAAIVYEGNKEVASIGFFHDLREELRMKSELEETQNQLLQAEKMSSLGKLSAGVAHQLNNPLGGITLFAKLILEEYDLEDGVKEDINRILQDAQRCRDTVKELLEFSRQTSYIVRPHDLNEAVSRTLFLLENQTLFQNIEIERDLAEGLPKIPVNIQQMNHVFMNIILNAAQAMEGKGELVVQTRLSKDSENIIIEITDTGPGIPEEVLKHVFEPFFTTKEEGEGTGLGLSMVYGIIEDHGGKISVRSKPGEGTCFAMELPLTTTNYEEEDDSGE